jgi:hypothetical protein
MQRLCGAEGSTASVQLDMFVDEPNKLGMLVSDFAAQLTTAWWRRHGHLCPALQKQAMNILSIPATSSGCSVRSKLIWSDRRQRLQQGRMWLIAYIYFNTRALKRATAAVSWEEFEEWMRRLPVPEDEDVIVAEHSSDKGSDGGSSNEEDAPTTE